MSNQDQKPKEPITAKGAFNGFMKESGLGIVYPEGNKMRTALKEASFATLERIITELRKQAARGSADPEKAYIDLMTTLEKIDSELAKDLEDSIFEDSKT